MNIYLGAHSLCWIFSRSSMCGKGKYSLPDILVSSPRINWWFQIKVVWSFITDVLCSLVMRGGGSHADLLYVFYSSAVAFALTVVHVDWNIKQLLRNLTLRQGLSYRDLCPGLSYVISVEQIFMHTVQITSHVFILLYGNRSDGILK